MNNNHFNDYQLIASSTGNASIKMWTQGVPVDPKAQEQLLSTASMPFIFKHLAVMPAQSSLVEIVHTLRQVVCVKG